MEFIAHLISAAVGVFLGYQIGGLAAMAQTKKLLRHIWYRAKPGAGLYYRACMQKWLGIGGEWTANNACPAPGCHVITDKPIFFCEKCDKGACHKCARKTYRLLTMADGKQRIFCQKCAKTLNPYGSALLGCSLRPAAKYAAALEAQQENNGSSTLSWQAQRAAYQNDN